jgi:hypothetical protein
LGPRWKTRQRAIADHSAKPDCGPQRHDRAELVVTGQPWRGANATALKAIATAENQMRHGKVFNLRDQDDGSHRIWSAKVADPHGRQFNLTISNDGSSVVSLNEDKTPTTMSARCGQPRSRLKTPSTPPSSRPEARAT